MQINEKAELARLRSELQRIADFGKQNPGRGFSCARMAEAALNGESFTPKPY